MFRSSALSKGANMPVSSAPLPISDLPRASARTSPRANKPLRIVALVVIAAIAVVVGRAVAAGTSSPSNVLSPGLQLAVGTLHLEGTGQAVDASQAAALLPLWELLAQLNTSSSAAPEEVSAVIEEIKLNMTAAQISAIDAMPASNFNLGAASGSPAASSTASGTNSAAAGAPMLAGGIGGAPMVGGGPMDGGGPMPSGSRQSTSSSKTTATASGPIQQVIELLQSKVQG
jgi:hypothetical protein